MKLVTLFGLLLKTEASYNAGGALSTPSDGVLLMEPAKMPYSYAHEGERGRAPGNGGRLRRGRPSGLHTEFEVKVEGRGRSDLYSATNIASDLHNLLRISGHSATLDATLGAEKYTFAPVSDVAQMASGVAEGYARGQKYPMQGLYATWGWEIDGPGFMVHTFNLSGLVSLPADASVPAIAYLDTDPPKAVNVGLTLGGWAGGVVRSASFTQGRSKSARANINSAGHQGFAPGGREPEIKVTIEAVALATFNPYQLRDAGTVIDFGLAVGNVKYNIQDFKAPRCQIVGVEEGEDENTATWELTLQPYASTPGALDDYTFILL